MSGMHQPLDQEAEDASPQLDMSRRSIDRALLGLVKETLFAGYLTC